MTEFELKQMIHSLEFKTDCILRDINRDNVLEALKELLELRGKVEEMRELFGFKE